MKLKYITQDEDRHGTPRIYVRRFGRYVRLRTKPDTPEFIREYGAALVS